MEYLSVFIAVLVESVKIYNNKAYMLVELSAKAEEIFSFFTNPALFSDLLRLPS